MRLLITSKLNGHESYGGSNRALHLGRHLAEEVSVYQVGPDCSAVNYAGSRSTGSRSVRALARGVRKAISDFDPDVVFALESRANLACRLLRLGRGRPRLVVGFDSSPAFEWHTYGRSADLNPVRCTLRYALSRTLERTIVSGEVPIVVVSDFLRTLVTQWYGVASSRTHVVPNGAPPELLTRPRAPGPSPYAALGDGVTALMIAPRNYHSNVLAVRFAHRMAERLRNRNPGIRLVIVGGGPQVGTTQNVHYVGYVDDVVPYIDFADVCLLPYPDHAVCGGSRLKAMEYLARGKPVLTTPEGIRGIDDLRDGVETIVAPADAEQFGEFLIRALGSRETLARLGSAGRALVVRRYNWRLLARQLLAVFEAVL